MPDGCLPCTHPIFFILFFFQGGILGDEMRLGKTCQMVGLLVLIHRFYFILFYFILFYFFQGGNLSDKMGLGKTCQTVIFLVLIHFFFLRAAFSATRWGWARRARRLSSLYSSNCFYFFYFFSGRHSRGRDGAGQDVPDGYLPCWRYGAGLCLLHVHMCVCIMYMCIMHIHVWLYIYVCIYIYVCMYIYV